VKIDPLAPPEPPEGLVTEVERGGVRLRWTPEPEKPQVDEPPDYPEDVTEEALEEERVGEIVFAFNVYRRKETENEDYPATPLNPAPILESVFEDRSAAFGTPLCYVIRRVALTRVAIEKEEAVQAEAVEALAAEAEPETTEPETTERETPEEQLGEAEPAEAEPVETELVPLAPLVESVDSEEVCLTPTDTFPPASPSGVIAVLTPEGILLTWREVDTKDLQGYLVYRSREEEGPFELLTPAPIPMAGFTDRDTAPGVEYYYAVSAVDQVEPWNESRHSLPVSVRTPEIR
jgi:hypothetical protein